jgi:hypothetical protein
MLPFHVNTSDTKSSYLVSKATLICPSMHAFQHTRILYPQGIVSQPRGRTNRACARIASTGSLVVGPGI